MTTRAEAIDAAGRAYAEARELMLTLPVEEAARLAYTPTGPSIEEIEAQIRAIRATSTSRPAPTPMPGGDTTTPAARRGSGRGRRTA